MSASSKGKSKSAAHTEANRLAHIGIPWSNARRKAFINTNEGVRRAETIKKRGGYAKVLWYDGRTRKYKNKQDAILQIVK